MPISKALELAKEVKGFHHRLGCVITDKKGKIISTGYNKRKTHPLQVKHSNRHGKKKYFLHAEIAALVKCRKQPHTLYVARLTKGDKIGMAKPCPICMDAIIEAGVKVIVYTNNKGETNKLFL